MVAAKGFTRWLERVDPGTHRRIKGLRLVTAYAIAALLGSQADFGVWPQDRPSLGFLAGGFALWASVSEARATRPESTRDLIVLCAAAVLGAWSMIVLSPILVGPDRPGPLLVLSLGAFLVGFLRRYGILGAGCGSQIFIGQLLAFGAGLTTSDLAGVAVSGGLAAVGAVVPRLLSGPAEHPPAMAAAPLRAAGWPPPELRMGLQSALGALVIAVLAALLHLREAAWAITACTYVVAGSATGTIDRVRRRIIGTVIGVPLGIACLPVAAFAPLLVWSACALAMVVYAMALPDRYDVACGAYAFTLMATLAVTGEHSLAVLAARAWETLLGGGLGAAAALLVFPLRAPKVPDAV